MSVRRDTYNRLSLIRTCHTCGRTFPTTAASPFMRQITNLSRVRKPVINTYSTARQIYGERSERPTGTPQRRTGGIIWLTANRYAKGRKRRKRRNPPRNPQKRNPPRRSTRSNARSVSIGGISDTTDTEGTRLATICWTTKNAESTTGINVTPEPLSPKRKRKNGPNTSKGRKKGGPSGSPLLYRVIPRNAPKCPQVGTLTGCTTCQCSPKRSGRRF